MKIKIVMIILLMMPFFSCEAKGKILSKKELKKYFKEEKVIELIMAASRGDVAKIDRFVAQGADVNCKGKDNLTPLFCVALSLNIPGFKRLLEHGADPNIPMTNGDSVIWWLTYGSKPEELIDMLKLALQHGGNPNWTFHNDPQKKVIRVNEGEPLIVTAVASDQAIEKIKLLLDAGADINAKDNKGFNALWAAVPQHYDVAYFLLQAGADYTAKNNSGKNFIWSMETFPASSFRGKKDLEKQREYRQKVIEFLRQKGIVVQLKNP